MSEAAGLPTLLWVDAGEPFILLSAVGKIKKPRFPSSVTAHAVPASPEEGRADAELPCKNVSQLTNFVQYLKPPVCLLCYGWLCESLSFFCQLWLTSKIPFSLITTAYAVPAFPEESLGAARLCISFFKKF
ncbi:MAG: hypothetical protein ACI4I5_06790 [Acutalibacteraceae bacterium]